MTTEELLIHELAERAGVSVRTIRYYIEEGLLPPPSYEGKYAYYTPRFLDRLELIRRLKDSYLPLREIREIMSSLTDEEVRRRLSELSLPSPRLSGQAKAARARTKPGSRALDYIDRVMDEQTKYRTKGTQEKNQPALDQDINSRFTAQIHQPSQFPAAPPEETWLRVTLAPGVELHLRRPTDPETESQIQQLINFTKRIFHNKSQGGIK
jgi:DNA-binding transcriptional MerR regulator